MVLPGTLLVLAEEEVEVREELPKMVTGVDHDHDVEEEEAGALGQEMGEDLTKMALRDVPITDIMKRITQLNQTTTKVVVGMMAMVPVVGTQIIMAAGTTVRMVAIVATMLDMITGKI